MSNTRKRITQPKPKKTCSSCGKEKQTSFYFKVDSPLFPDGMINICRDCVREQVDVEDINEVIGFLRQIDKPFVERIWKEAVQSGNHPLGEYIRKVNSLQQLKGKTFEDSEGIQGIGKTGDVQIASMPDTIETLKGTLVYSDELVDKWGIGYKKHEYLQMEKFYVNMRETHEINTEAHVDQLRQLSYLTVDRDRLRQAGDWANYTKLSKTIEDMTKSAGFRPVDRQGLDDATGIRSFSQIFEEVEKRGFRKPPAVEFDDDVVDKMIISLANYYHRLVGRQILSELPDEIKKDMDGDEFYELDETPVDLNDEEYDELDFSIEEDENEQ
ncbi:hypothetical protein [Bacillus stercoris]|uniref:hypothetical protein n=1 Tax=Bacillus stercoris TaxID=2054641 RepID=UPI003CEBE507